MKQGTYEHDRVITCEEMRQTFPDYPCGRENCRHSGNERAANNCGNNGVSCPLWREWVSKRWRMFRECFGTVSSKTE